MPFWDDGTQCLYLAGKGDGNIRYFEYEHDKLEYLSEYRSSDPQRGIAFLPKRGVNLHENEITRAFKTVNDSYIEPISFIVPRRAEVFQEDVYPPTFGLKPAMTAAEWFDGKEGIPPKIDLASVYEGEEPTEVPSDYKSSPGVEAPAPKAPSPTKKEPEPAKEPAQPSPITRGPPPSMKEQTNTMRDLASKYTDADEDSFEEKEDDTSSFEEVSKPIERHLPAATKPIEKAEPSPIPKSLSPTESQPPKSQISPLPVSEPASSSAAPGPKSPPPTSGSSSSEPLQGYLKEIKSLLEQQNATMTAQSDKIAALTREVDALKTVVAQKDERGE